MKKLILILLIFGFIFSSSCSNESFENELIEEVDENEDIPDGEEDQEEDDNPDPDDTINLTPCDFSLEGIASNSSVTISCTMDLEGATINLPANTTLIFDNGQIINGTLQFASGGTIDGDLLNINLDIQGEVILSDNSFDFRSNRWEIKSGTVSDEIAEQNKLNLQSAIDLSKRLGAQIFNTDELDAFFKVGLGHGGQQGLSENGIHIPSNFRLEMSENTYLRVQPTHFPWYVLLSTYKVENVTITGGTLIGDRYEHDYSDFIDGDNISRKTHEWPALIVTAGSSNIVFENINIEHSTGDGFIVGSAGFRTNPGAVWNEGIVLRNCTLDGNRRNNISITDGENITVVDNLIINAGDGPTNPNGVFNSAGVNPRYGLDVEPYVEYASFDFASRVQYEWVENVSISNNRFEDNYAGSIVVYSGDKVSIDNNTADHSISLNETTGSNITNNTVEARSNVSGRVGITTSDFRRYTDFIGGNIQQYALNNNVSGNTVRGFTTGYYIRGSEAEITRNFGYENEVSLIVDRAEDLSIHDNIYESSLPNSAGIILGSYGNNVKIFNENVSVAARYLFVNNYNRNLDFSSEVESFTVEISNCVLSGNKSSRVFDAIGVHLINNQINTGTEFVQTDGTRFLNNTVVAEFVDGVILDNSMNCQIIENNFTLSANYEPVVVMNEPTNANNTIENN
ncbi:hypothetical protein [uncultured Aquimarina sp.]|uniref:hypothetical protein n=1 Tax=uncultured Aquimarina sp. TaxID=575652 RepID=UPI00261CBB1A|nr:hypothetical protein [uncultured Aquimarina sp.]